MRFDGDIIITDPCYIIKEQDMSTKPKWDDFMDRPSYAGMSREQLVDCGFFEMQKKLNEAQKEWEKLNPDDWELCEYGEDMSLIGIENCVTSDTGYGDWSCTVFEKNRTKNLESFARMQEWLECFFWIMFLNIIQNLIIIPKDLGRLH